MNWLLPYIMNQKATEFIKFTYTLMAHYIFVKYKMQAKYMAEFVEFVFNFFFFVLVLFINLSRYDTNIQIPLFSDVDKANAMFIIYVAFTRCEKIYIERKKRLVELSRGDILNGRFDAIKGDRAHVVMSKKRLSAQEMVMTTRCSLCDQYPQIDKWKVKYIDPVTVYRAHHKCLRGNIEIGTEYKASRNETIGEWNSIMREKLNI